MIDLNYLNNIVLKPVVTEADYQEASAIIDKLIDADLIEDVVVREKAGNLLEAVTILALEYERKHYPIEPLDAIEAIKVRMEMLNLSQKDVAKYFGGENRVSEVLNKKRPLTMKMAKALHKYLGIPAELLLAY